MLLFWRIRYLDSRDKQFKDRDLFLVTEALDPATRAAVEAAYEIDDLGDHRGMLRYRHLFREGHLSGAEFDAERHDISAGVLIPDYFEDENGKELTRDRMGSILTGDPNIVMLPGHFKQHDVDFVMADKRPIDLEQLSLAPGDLEVLGIFTRDMREMASSAFLKEGPGRMTGSVGGGDLVPETAVTDEEIRSFVTIFRRLYMEKEPANFLRAVAVFEKAVRGYPLANWVKGVAGEYKAGLSGKPDLILLSGKVNWPFSRKRLIDVFLYTQYAHQPDERRTRQYEECLAALGSRRTALLAVFLVALWESSLHLCNAGNAIADFYECYCEVHKVSPGVLSSGPDDNAGLGTLEKKESRRARILREKAEELAMEMWRNSGRPMGGPAQFFGQAHEQLRRAMGNTDGGQP